MKASGIDLAPPSPSPDPRRGAPPRDARGDDFDGALREASAEPERAGDPERPVEPERLERADSGPADADLTDPRESDPSTAAASADAASAAAAIAASLAATASLEKAPAADPHVSASPIREHRGRVGEDTKTSSPSAAAGAFAVASAANSAVASELPSDGAQRVGADATIGARPARVGSTASGESDPKGHRSLGPAEPPSGSRDELAAASGSAHLAAPTFDLTAASAAVISAPAGGPAARSAIPVESPTLPAAVRQAEDGATDGAVLRNAAHLRVAAPGVGELELHLRVRDGVAHVRVDGDAARVVESRAAELSRALAGEGLRLGQLDAKAPAAASSSTGSAQGDAASHHHRDRGHERGETPPGTPPRPPRALGVAGAASPLPAGRYAVRA